MSNYGLASLEQRCLYPGRWKVEGYHVQRVGKGRSVCWQVRESSHGPVLHSASSLLACREWIFTQNEQPWQWGQDD